MAVKIVNYYLAEPYHPTYYIFLYNGQHTRTERPTRPFQIFRADTWPEAKNFAAAFVSKATDQWMGVSSLSPKGGKMTIEVAHVDYWKEGDQVFYEESRLPADVVKSMSEAITHEPIANETDPAVRKRIEAARKAISNLKPGQSYIDVVRQQQDTEFAARSKKRTEELFKHGQHNPEQGKLYPEEEEKRLREEEEQPFRRRSRQPDLDEYGEERAHEKEGESLLPCTHCGKLTLGRCTACRKPVCEKCWHISKDYHDERGEPARFVTTLEAHEKEPTLADPRGYFPFRNWVINHKMPEADSMLLNEALDDAKVAGKDLTYEEAKDKVKNSLETSDKPWSQISQSIDWNTITMEEEQRHQVSEAAEIVKAALEAGIIQAKDVGLYRKNPASMSVEEKRAFQKQIEDLERQLQEARKPPPSQYGTGKPSIRSAPLNYTQDQIDLLYNYFQTQLERSLKRSPSAPELNRFDEFINRIQRVKPAIKFDRLKGQVEDIAMALAALARGASIPRKTESQRLRDLLEKMLISELTPEEEDEVSKLEGTLEDAEHMPLGLMEPDRPRPHIRVIAESGPEKYLLGRPLAMDQPGPYPRELMRTWEMENAQINKENFEKKGYVIRIEEF